MATPARWPSFKPGQIVLILVRVEVWTAFIAARRVGNGEGYRCGHHARNGREAKGYAREGGYKCEFRVGQIEKTPSCGWNHDTIIRQLRH